MCGIAGIIRLSDRPLPRSSILDSMVASIDHRGPDSFGRFVNEDVHLGVVRLAVTDPKFGDQPVNGCRGRSVTIFNGEVYNHHDLRQRLRGEGHRIESTSDSEVVSHLYEDEGVDFVDSIRGMFAIAVWDAQRRKLVLARDRLGIKPLFYHLGRDYLIFASEIKAIVSSGLVDLEIDRAALEELLAFSYPIPPRTMFSGIRELLPAHLMEVAAQSHRVINRRYWTCPFPPSRARPRESIHDSAANLRSLLERRVQDHIVADVPVATYLSGGLDSSAIAALFRQVTGSAPQTFSISFDSPDHDESEVARVVRSHLGAKGQTLQCGSRLAAEFERMIWHTELPLQFPLALPLMALSRTAKEAGFSVVLTGDGADEIFGGYDAFKADKMRRVFDRPGLRTVRGMMYTRLYQWSGLPIGTVEKMKENHARAAKVRSAYRGVYPPWFDMWTAIRPERDGLLTSGDRHVRSVWDASEDFLKLLPDDIAELDPLDGSIALELVTRLPSWILLISDRSSMANGVEARVPFLDHEVVEFVASLPAKLKMNGFQEKYLLRRSVSNLLPKFVAERPKRPFFTPIEEWFFGRDAPDFVDESLSKKSIERAGLFDSATVDQYRRQLPLIPRGHLLRRQIEWTLCLVLGTQVLDQLFMSRFREVAKRRAN